MSKEARHHHYIPQCYLKGFLPKKEGKSNLCVIDLKQKKHFDTGTRNICGIKDFNRINIEGLEPDSIENRLSFFEGQVATALKEIEKEKNLNNKETYDVIMNLIALLGIRHPQTRKHSSDTEARILKMAMQILLASKNHWESTKMRMKKDCIEIDDNVSYEELKKFVDSDKYDIVMQNESHLAAEFCGIDAILPFLFNRKWTLVLSSEKTGPFITSDRPVSLTWQYPEKLPRSMQYSPGYGMKDTEVVFPVSQEIAVIGTFENQEQVLRAEKDFVALINSRIMAFTVSQLYAPSLSFNFIDKHANISNGYNITKSW